ncbi:MAG: lactonase family protein [Opitutaceae bacterium]|jgi:6-phosphogluconolactonase
MTSVAPYSADNFIYIGTQTKFGTSKGIYAFRFDPVAGKVEKASPVAEASNPSFLTQHPRLGVLYAACDVPSSEGMITGTVSAYALDAMSGCLASLNSVQVGTPGAPCHLAISTDGQALLSAYYYTGVASSLSVQPDGRLGMLVSHILHEGPTGPNAARQTRPHAHAVTISPDGRFVFACDLGMDRVLRYALDSRQAKLTPAEPAFIQSAPGVGPRHAEFSSDGRHFYVLNELAGSLDVFSYHAPDGGLSLLQTLSTLPKGFTGQNISAEVQIHRNGRFVYASNRGHDSLAVFQRDEASGRLALVEHMPSGGRHPRHFALSPDNAFLFCANRDTNNIAVFRVNGQTGKLEKTGLDVTVPTPTCVLFAR